MTKIFEVKTELNSIVDAALSLNVNLEDRQTIEVCDGVKLELYYYRQKFIIETVVDGFWSNNIALVAKLKGRYKYQGEPRVESISLKGSNTCSLDEKDTENVIQAYERQVACQLALNHIAKAFLDNKGVLIQKAIELFELEEAEDEAYQNEINKKEQEKNAAIQVKKDEFAKVNDVISDSVKWCADRIAEAKSASLVDGKASKRYFTCRKIDEKTGVEMSKTIGLMIVSKRAIWTLDGEIFSRNGAEKLVLDANVLDVN